MPPAQQILEAARQELGDPPRDLGFFTRWKLKTSPPPWMPRTDPLREIYEYQDLLLTEGRIVWCSLVQANMLFFEPGPHDHPALGIYSTDPYFDGALKPLQAIAHRLFSLKNTKPADPREQRLAEKITDEMDRSGWTVPPEMTGGRAVFASSLMIVRKHLPGRFLQSTWLPLLTHPETASVMVLPSRFWPEELVHAWMPEEE